MACRSPLRRRSTLHSLPVNKELDDLGISSRGASVGKLRIAPVQAFLFYWVHLAESLGSLCCRPVMKANISEAALFRKIKRDKPALILNEAETLRNRNSERAQLPLDDLSR